MINVERFNEILVEFKKDFPGEHWKGEKYKWKAVKCFQDNWDIDAPDFLEMFLKATSKTYNLLASMRNYPRAMIKVFAEKELGCDDEEILTAVRYHTTGRSNMTLLEKVIFIADFIGKERDYDGVEVMREKAFRSLDEAIVEGLSFTIIDLIKKERLVHPDTMGAYNSALLAYKGEKGEKLI